MKSGLLGELGEAQRAENRSRISAANKQPGPLPWSVEEGSPDPDWNTTLQALLGESDGMPVLDFEFELPRGIKPKDIKLDLYTKRLALLDDGIWVAKIPWPEEPEDDQNVLDDSTSEDLSSPGQPDQSSPTQVPADDGDPKGPQVVWKRIELTPRNNSHAIQAEFYGEDGQMIAARGNTVFLIDTEYERIIRTVQTTHPIRHLSVATRTGDLAVVDDQGKIHFVAAELKDIYEVGRCDLELPMPVISAEAGRIASYHTPTVGRIYKIQDSQVVDHFDVTLTGAKTPKLLCSTPSYDYWIDESGINRRPNYPHKKGDDFKTWRFSVYWDIRQAVPVGVVFDQPWLFCVAERPQPGGETELVGFDCEFGAREFYKPLPWARYKDATWTISGDSWQIAVVEGNHVQIATRMIKHPQNLYALRSRSGNMAWNQQYQMLDAMAAIVRKLPEQRMNRTPEQLYGEIVEGTCAMWKAARKQADNKSESKQQRDLAEASLEAARQWVAKRSTLALCCEMRTKRGELESVETIWKELAAHDDIPLAAYVTRISTAQSNGDQKLLASVLKECVERYPMELAAHQLLVYRCLEKAGGTRGSASAYASAIGNAIGSPHGDFVYAQLINRISVHFRYAFFNYAFVDGQRVLAGIREGLRTGYWQESSTLGCMMVLGTSHSQEDAAPAHSPYAMAAKQLTAELADYYRHRYPMLINDDRRNWIKWYVVEHLPQ